MYLEKHCDIKYLYNRCIYITPTFSQNFLYRCREKSKK